MNLEMVKLRVFQTRKRYTFEIVVTIISGLIQLLYMKAVPFSGGYDSLGYLAIGRMYADLPYEMWSIKYYYPPGLSFIFLLTGITHFGTFFYYTIFIWLLGTTLPLLIYKILEPFGKRFALVSCLFFSIFLQGAIFSKDLMPHFLGGYMIILLTLLCLKQMSQAKIKSFSESFWRPILIGTVLFCSYLVRPSNLYIGVVLILLNFILNFCKRAKKVRSVLKVFGLIFLQFLILNLLIVSIRPTETDQQHSKLTVIQNQGAFTMLQGLYTGSSIVNGRPSLNPSCGVATKQMYLITERYLNTLPYPSSIVFAKYPNLNKKSAIENVLRDWWQIQGYASNFYFINWALESELTFNEKDQMMSRSIRENFVCSPLAYLRYFSLNSIRALKGEVWNYGEFESRGIIFEDSSWRTSYGLPQVDFFKAVSVPNLERNLVKDYVATESNKWASVRLEQFANFFIKMLPLINLFAFFGLLITRGLAQRYLLLLLSAGIGNILLVSLCWPVQLRYYYPSIPFFFMAASLTIQKLLKIIFEQSTNFRVHKRSKSPKSAK